MTDETLKIEEISTETISAIKKRSAYALPDNPSASGMKPGEIKKAFWAPIISEFGSIYTELARVIKEINAAFASLQGEDEEIAQSLVEGLSTAQSNLQSALDSHDVSESSHENIRKSIENINALLDEKLKTISAWQEEESELPPAYSLLKELKGEFDGVCAVWSPKLNASVKRIEYDKDKGDLILYFNNDDTVRVELPLERLVGEGYYDEESRTIRLSLDGGDELVIPVGDLVDEYEGDGETIEVYREGGVRKIRILPALKKKIDMAHTHDNKEALDSFTQELKESYDRAADQAGKAYSAVLDANNLYSNVLLGTLTGKAARADDVSPLSHKFNISLKGESTQESEPTIDAPVEVVHCDSPTVKLFRKNLLKYPYWSTTGYPGGMTAKSNSDGSLTLNGTIDGSKLVQSFVFYNKADAEIPMIVLKKGVTYRALLLDENGNNANNQFGMRICDGNSYASLFTNNISSYTPSADKPIYRILLYALESASGTTFTNKVVYPMLEIVGESDEYGEYSEQSVTIPLTLAGQGDYKDEIVVDQNTKTVKHIQRYYKYEFTGEETWKIITSSYSVNTTLAMFSLSSVPSTFSVSKYTSLQLCNTFPCVMNYSKDVIGIYATSPGVSVGIFARIPVADATSSDFNEVFKSGTYLWYPMAEPIETDYTDTEWGQALLALVSDGETLTFDCDAETTINYNKDVNKVIQKLTDAIIALGGTI